MEKGSAADAETLRTRTLKSLHGEDYEDILRKLRDLKERHEEEAILAPYATKSKDSLGRAREEGYKLDNRTDFARDRDRIIHSRAFFRLSGKTQVFISPNNPLVSTRMTHTLQVAQVSRALARAMGLNEDLTEAIALGHDLGHPPFGHAGEIRLNAKLAELGLPPFRHNVHSLRVVDVLEKNGKGLNLTFEVREGILCHDGERDSEEVRPQRERRFVDLSALTEEELRLNPSTPEACLVRLCDRIAYVGKDIEDGIEAGLFEREDIPKEYTKVLGNTNKMIMDTLVKDITMNHHKFLEGFRKEHGRDPLPHEFRISISGKIRDAVNGLINEFNYKTIYISKENMRYIDQTAVIINSLFDSFLEQLRSARVAVKNRKLTDFMEPDAKEDTPKEAIEKVMRDAFLKMELGMLSDFMSVFHKGTFLEDLPVELKEEWVALIRESMDKLSDEEFEACVREAVGRAKMRILDDHIALKGDDFAQIFHFLKRMDKGYLERTECWEMARDYLASLTDRTAITIFQRLNIPQAIV